MKVLHITFLIDQKWGYRIINSCKKAFDSGIFQTESPWEKDAFLHTASRLDGLVFSITKLNETTDQLMKEISNIDPVELKMCLDEDRSYFLSDRFMRQAMMFYIHSFLYEIDSCLEFITNHVLLPIYHNLHQWNKNKIKDHISIKLSEQGINPTYIREVTSLRNHFTHHASAHIAVDIDRQDIIIMKKNILDFSETSTSEFIYLKEDLSRLNDEFWKSIRIIEEIVEADIQLLLDT
ncbi:MULTISPECIES: hypothetical protein [Paenibacillus]|jgi:hypothetical protein|uniref:Cthe-2314-like HEPN domain-containing protein n=1 Tax=Paenibacillus barengoltzii J12 TaxID=935846 RepID=A0ABY1M3J6_9BACL|nr:MULTISPECIES: hypothetical protein [Paenibacillus]SMF69329.1 hypothetical protein SAMN02744124_04390 [Paenibacillus barengoltzii J12]